MNRNAVLLVLMRIAVMATDVGTPMIVTPGSTAGAVALQLTAQALATNPASAGAAVRARAAATRPFDLAARPFSGAFSSGSSREPLRAHGGNWQNAPDRRYDASRTTGRFREASIG